jgi:hypothetical protein
MLSMQLEKKQQQSTPAQYDDFSLANNATTIVPRG